MHDAENIAWEANDEDEDKNKKVMLAKQEYQKIIKANKDVEDEVYKKAEVEVEAAKWHAECVAQEDSKGTVKTVYRTEYTMVTNEPKHFTEEEIFELFKKFTARLKEESD